jgi:predicted nucleotidyltransferase
LLERDHLLVRSFPVQFLAAEGLTAEAVREAEQIEFEGVRAKVFRAEHIIAIAATVGRQKDKARIQQLLQQANVDQSRLETILQRYKLQLPVL